MIKLNTYILTNKRPIQKIKSTEHCREIKNEMTSNKQYNTMK